jgi:hypothetical protein
VSISLVIATLSKSATGRFQAPVVFSRLLVQMFAGVAQGGARHGGSMFVQESQQSLSVFFAGFAQPALNGLVDQVVLVLEEQFGDLKGIRHLALADEVRRADDRCAALPDVSERASAYKTSRGLSNR